MGQKHSNMSAKISDKELKRWDQVYKTFDAMGLNQNLLRGIYDYGFKKPFYIQREGIVPFCHGLDMIQEAPSGAGKTINYCLGILQRLDYEIQECQAIVLVPTSEYAKQVKKDMSTLGSCLDVRVHAVLGVKKGNSNEDQELGIIKSGVHVVVGTPERLYELLVERVWCTHAIATCVIDGVELLQCSKSKEQIKNILGFLQKKKKKKIQVGVFLTTMTQEALEIKRKFMNNPLRLVAKHEHMILDHIKMYHVKVDKDECKLYALLDLYNYLFDDERQTIIFVNTIAKVDWLLQRLQSRESHKVVAIHQEDMMDILPKEFELGYARVLITTDLLMDQANHAGQGALVVNYDLPTKVESFLKRIRRSCTPEKRGLVMSFVCREEEGMFMDIQRFYNIVY